MIKDKLEKMKLMDEDIGLKPSFIKPVNNVILEFNNIGVNKVPSQILDLYQFTNGTKGITLSNILSIEEIGKMIQDENSEYATTLKEIGKFEEFQKYCPFQRTGMGGFYLFEKNSSNETISTIDIDGENEIFDDYANLEDFLDWQIEMKEA